MTEDLSPCINKDRCKTSSYTCVTDSSICGNYNLNVFGENEGLHIDFYPETQSVHVWCSDGPGGYSIATLLVKDGVWTVKTE